ncbi:MAG: hypothetical protein ACREVW_17475, partial [Burkholderiales bacterium]
LVDIAALVLIIKFLLHGAFFQGLLRSTVPVSIQLAPAWQGGVQWGAAGLCAIIIVLTVSALAQGYWNRFALQVSVIVNLLLAAALFWIAVHPEAIVVVVHSDALPVNGDSMLQGCRIFIGVAAAIGLGKAIRQAAWLRQSDQETG